MRAGRARRAQQPRQPRDQPPCVARIRPHRGHHLRHVHRAVALVPAIVIGDHRHARVAKLGLAGEFCLGHAGHADHVAAPDLAVEPAFGEGRKLRPLHRKVSATTVHPHPLGGGGAIAGIGKPRAGRVRDTYMRHAARPEERFLAREGAVDELIDNHEIARRHFLAERPAGGNGDQVGHPQPLHRVDIGAVGHRGGAVHMAAAVAG